MPSQKYHASWKDSVEVIFVWAVIEGKNSEDYSILKHVLSKSRNKTWKWIVDGYNLAPELCASLIGLPTAGMKVNNFSPYGNLTTFSEGKL